MYNMKEATGTPFAKQHKHLQRGDWIGIVGFPGRTQPKSQDSRELSKTFMSLNISQKPWLNKYGHFCSGGVPPHTLPASGTHIQHLSQPLLNLFELPTVHYGSKTKSSVTDSGSCLVPSGRIYPASLWSEHAKTNLHHEN